VRSFVCSNSYVKNKEMYLAFNAVFGNVQRVASPDPRCDSPACQNQVSILVLCFAIGCVQLINPTIVLERYLTHQRTRCMNVGLHLGG